MNGLSGDDPGNELEKMDDSEPIPIAGKISVKSVIQGIETTQTIKGKKLKTLLKIS